MFINLLLALAVIAVALIVVVTLQPADFHVSRSLMMAAPTGAVFPHVNDLRSWEAWSPFQKLDPAMKQTYEGPAAGTGATMAWAGNAKAGQGRMTITESRPNALVRFQLEFLKPFRNTNTAEFAFKPESGGTTVTWTMTGKKNFVTKGLSLFFGMDKMVGGQFERGLKQLEAIARQPARV